MVSGNGALPPEEGARFIRAAAAQLRKKELRHTFEWRGVSVTLALPHQADFARAMRNAAGASMASAIERTGGTLARADATEEERHAALAEIARLVETYGDVDAGHAMVMAGYVLELRDQRVAPEGEPKITLGWIEAIGVPLAAADTAATVKTGPAFVRELLAASAELANFVLSRLTNAAAFMAARREAELKNSNPPRPGGPAAETAENAKS